MPIEQNSPVYVKDLMTSNVITISPNASIVEVAQILFERNFDGLPVVDDAGRLLGIVTQYDLVSKGANIHLPTFIQLMKNLPIYKKDKNMIKPGLEKVVSMKVSDIMNTEPISVSPDQLAEDASRIFTEHHSVNPLTVIDNNKILKGVISRYDIIRLYTGSMAAATTISHEKSVDKKVDIFMKHFGKSFVVVSKFRTKFWLIASLLFTIVGFAIAFMLITRVEFR